MRKEYVASDVIADNYVLCSQEMWKKKEETAVQPNYHHFTSEYSKIKHTEVQIGDMTVVVVDTEPEVVLD